MHVGAQYFRSLKHLWAIEFHVPCIPIPFPLSHPTQQWPFWWMTMVSQATGPPIVRSQWCSTLMLAQQACGFGWLADTPKWRASNRAVDEIYLVIGEYNFVCKFWIPVLIYYQIIEGAPCQGSRAVICSWWLAFCFITFFLIGDLDAGCIEIWYEQLYEHWFLVFTSLASRPSIPTLHYHMSTSLFS